MVWRDLGAWSCLISQPVPLNTSRLSSLSPSRFSPPNTVKDPINKKREFIKQRKIFSKQCNVSIVRFDIRVGLSTLCLNVCIWQSVTRKNCFMCSRSNIQPPWFNVNRRTRGMDWRWRDWRVGGLEREGLKWLFLILARPKTYLDSQCYLHLLT